MLCRMSKVEQIEAELAKLPTVEARLVWTWLDEYLADKWDEQIEADSRAGKLDFLFDEAEAERKAENLREWPGEAK
jgi:hypothetical protein